ncbi:MAG TPA: right-handed parallel beta-helix repeat-containing protein [Chthoniobacteraceae bacterium]|nr:right-handed parallel beta-helix repeat-containing protein [Chthoniobacteraceae bacterium]
MKKEWINAADVGASGSEFETRGEIKAGSRELRVEEIGDFQPGQWVTLSGVHLHHYGTVYNEREPYYARNQKPLEDEVELRGLDPSVGWQTFVIHFDATTPVTWRWMAVDPRYQTRTLHEPILRRVWCWQGEGLPLNEEWFRLADGVEIRFRKLDWLPGQSLAFHARNRLLTRIAGISDRTLTLEDAASGACEEALLRHHDEAALQAALDRAVSERRNLMIPSGRYRLSRGLWLRNASVQISGSHRDHTVLDMSEDHSAVFWIAGGGEIAIRNLAMVGHSGFLELPSYTHFATATGFPFWPTANQQMEIKGCSAVNAVGTEHLIFEDLKVSRMASEAFYLHGGDRYGTPPYIQAPHEGMPELHEQYTRSCVYHRCHVSDCGFNAFNNNDHAENTSILHCHVERATNFCEEASRFTRIIGNYVKEGTAGGIHGGKVVPGKVGSAQAIISDNVFEAGAFSGGLGINRGATQVIVSNNLFVGYSKESALFILGGRRVIVSGNHFDLSRVDDNPDRERCGICIEASNVTISDNQIYVRGETSEKVTGIHLADDAVNVHLHDNLIEHCGVGLRSGRRIYFPQERTFRFCHTEGEVEAVSSNGSFKVSRLPQRCDDPRPYLGWHLHWQSGPRAGESSTIAAFDGETHEIRLKESEPAPETGWRFAIYPPSANWQIHHNTITQCTRAIEMDLFSFKGVTISDNLTDE